MSWLPTSDSTNCIAERDASLTSSRASTISSRNGWMKVGRKAALCEGAWLTMSRKRTQAPYFCCHRATGTIAAVICTRALTVEWLQGLVCGYRQADSAGVLLCHMPAGGRRHKGMLSAPAVE
jgi:hypothetical protein